MQTVLSQTKKKHLNHKKNSLSFSALCFPKQVSFGIIQREPLEDSQRLHTQPKQANSSKLCKNVY
jgi:hypothetical protein